MDKYGNYEELQQQEKEGVDYELRFRKGTSGIAVIAPHGGGIEPGTVDIADGIAGAEHTFYCFKGIKNTGNIHLHITSNRFDEPLGINAIKGENTVLAIHGCNDKKQVVNIGGKDRELKKKLKKALIEAGFVAEESPRPGLRGENPENICNRGRSGRGAQLEISEGLRKVMFDNLTAPAGRKKTKVFCRFVTALRKSLQLHTG